MNIIYSLDKRPSADQIIELYNNAGLPRPTYDKERIQKMFDNSNLIVTAWDENVLVGVSRSITDWVWACYLSDLAVRDEYKKEGIGRQLINLTKEKLGDQSMILLLSVPMAMEYYPKVGFEKQESSFYNQQSRMEITPIEIFNKWFAEELSLTKVNIPTACCLSTLGQENYPNARFVSLKGIVENNFIVTGTLTSRKGLEISNSNKVALTFWWTETERQVRIQGDATMISNELADKYFEERKRDSQIVSIVSRQGQTVNDIEELNIKYQNLEIEFSDRPLTRPNNWGGYYIKPIRIELLEFKATRFHDRKLFEFKEGKWTMKQLQP